MTSKKLTAMVLSLAFFLDACVPSGPPPAPEMSNAQNSLAEASYSVSRSISSLSELAQAAHQSSTKLDPPPNPESYGMAGVTSIDWSGPVEPLIKQIAKVANYRLRVLGPPPAIPIIVTLYDKNIMLADALRDAGYQCGRRAEVVIFPDSRVIELRYAKN